MPFVEPVYSVSLAFMQYRIWLISEITENQCKTKLFWKSGNWEIFEIFRTQGLFYKVRACMWFFRNVQKKSKIRNKKCWKGATNSKYLKIWAKMYKIWKYFEKGQVTACDYHIQ